jgi:uncharacterized membrane protein
MAVMMSGFGTGWPAWAIALMWIGMIAVLAILAWAAYALFTRSARRPGRGQGSTSARSVLDQRLASGQIDITEYQRLRGLIAAGDHQAPAGTAGGT